MKRTLYLLILCNLIIDIHITATSDYYRCNSSTNITINSTYVSLRDGLLFSLPGEVKDQGGYYYGSTITFTSSPVPYCLGLCREDLVPSDACFNCISTSISDLTRNCKTQDEVIAWGPDAGCMVQCSPHKSSQPYEIQPAVHDCNSTNVSVNYASQFSRVLANLTDRIAVKAADQGSLSFFPTGYNAPQYIASEASEFTEDQSIYGVGFCLPSLSASDCTACLREAGNVSDEYCKGKQGATILNPNCVLRYELYSFYKSTLPSTTPVSSPSNSSSPGFRKGNGKGNRLVIAVVLPLVAVIIIIILGVTKFMNKRKQSKGSKDIIHEAESMEPCFEFSLNTLRTATNDFSSSNKLGRGGFGTVYKGRLLNGQLIAVKRLARHTEHGEVEFKNEVRLLARLHHKNLIRLIGFGLGREEKVLVYELALNGSLDHILFDPSRREHLNWELRFSIIVGIARGLLYLHEESQLRIIHRDLKASNVLLDEHMNPKISDFGTARLFIEDLGSASKIVGTFGYMAPEYAKYGKISIKIDVFSFGVLLLEIVSGKKNSTKENTKRIEHLLSKAWKCWKEGKLLQLIDPIILRENNQADDVMRCVHIGLLCVQENAAWRPSMNQVLLMVEGCSQSLPQPSEPAYLMKVGNDKSRLITEELSASRLNESEPESDQATSRLTTSSKGLSSSINEVSFTYSYPEPR